MEDPKENQPNVIALAKQGEPKAIAFLFNRKLNDKGISVKASIKQDCLNLMFEADFSLPKQKIVDLVHKFIVSLGKANYSIVKVYGRLTKEEVPDWIEVIQIQQTAQKSLLERAKQRDAKAITEILVQALKEDNFKVKISLKETQLQIMLESLEVPERESSIEKTISILQSFEINSIQKIKIFGKKIDEDFPDWHKEIDLNLTIQKEENNPTAKKDNSAPRPKAEESDAIHLSNKIYTLLQDICYQRLSYKIDSEENKSIQDILQDFVVDLELDLRADIDQLIEELPTATKLFRSSLEASNLKVAITNVSEKKFAKVKLLIRDLERVTERVLQSELGLDSNSLTGFLGRITQGLTPESPMASIANGSKGRLVGATLGFFVAPVGGELIGGAIGHAIDSWLNDGKHDALFNTYDTAREKLLDEWEALLQDIYASISSYAKDLYGIQFLTYCVIQESTDRYHSGNELLESGDDLEGALRLYNEALVINPGLALAWNNKGFLLNQIGNYEEALEALDNAIKSDSDLSMAINNKGDSLKNLCRIEEALHCYERVIRNESENYLSWLGKATCLIAIENYDQALQACQKLIQLDPNDFNGWYNQSVCFAKMQITEQALENLKEAVKLSPEESQKLAKSEAAFENLRDDERFQDLMGSVVGVSYLKLKKLLKLKCWKEADEETAKVIGDICEEISDSRKFESYLLDSLPVLDISTIDQLWVQFSSGKFGFSVQKRVFQECSKDRNKFGERTGWRIANEKGKYYWLSNDQFDYDYATAPKGHLPSGLWAGEDGWFENRRDRLIEIFSMLEDISQSVKIASDPEVDGVEHKENAPPIDDMADFSYLESLLSDGLWKSADQETSRLMLRVLGKNSDDLFIETDLLNFPCSELIYINDLWKKFSDGRFGFERQKQIYLDCGATFDFQHPGDKTWKLFVESVGWKVNRESAYYKNIIFDLSAPDGHLPRLAAGNAVVVSSVLFANLFARLDKCFMICEVNNGM